MWGAEVLFDHIFQLKADDQQKIDWQQKVCWRRRNKKWLSSFVCWLELVPWLRVFWSPMHVELANHLLIKVLLAFSDCTEIKHTKVKIIMMHRWQTFKITGKVDKKYSHWIQNHKLLWRSINQVRFKRPSPSWMLEWRSASFYWLHKTHRRRKNQLTKTRHQRCM